METSQESFTFTVGKLDAGMAILLGERAHLIEFPSILLPPGATAGSIVNIAVHQNYAEEKRRDAEFWSLQNDILEEFGVSAPEQPQLQLRNITQTSVTLEWPSVKLATAKLRSLDLYRNGQRLAAIPAPTTNTSTKVSGLELNTEYSFQLILRTTAGTFPSNLIRVRTHTMTDTSGIVVCFGNVQDAVLLDNVKMALREMKAKWSDKIEIDTTHFICTTPAATPTGAEASGNAGAAPGVLYQRALQLSIPVLQPHWILACHTEKRMVPVASFYLGAASTPAEHKYRPQSMSQASLPRSPASPPATNGAQPSKTPVTAVRASMPPPARVSSATPPNNASTFVNQPASPDSQDHTATAGRFSPTPEEPTDNAGDVEEVQLERTTSSGSTDSASKRKSRAGTMNREFRFPSPASSPVIPDVQPDRAASNTKSPPSVLQGDLSRREDKPSVVTPTSIEVPPPPPVEKERRRSSLVDEGEDDVGDTVEVPLN